MNKIKVTIGVATTGLLGWWAYHRSQVAKSYGVTLLDAFLHPFTDVPVLWQRKRQLEMQQGI
jgi:hypothetical protein